MKYPERVPAYSDIPSLHFSEIHKPFYVHYTFMMLHRLIYTSERENAIRMLVYTSMKLYGWENTPLYQALIDPNATRKDIKDSRAQYFDEEGEIQSLAAVELYWSHHDSLLGVPMSWFRPHVIEGDTICNRKFRFQNRRGEAHLPSLENEPYRELRRSLVQVGRDCTRRCQDMERAFVEFYGGIKQKVISVQDIISAEPRVRERYLMDWDRF